MAGSGNTNRLRDVLKGQQMAHEITGDIFAWRDQMIAELDEESIRRKALVATRDFRRNWVEIGKTLTTVAYGGDYKEWGYEDFETYCAHELGLKKPTARKIMLSYQYMARNAPERLETAPDMDAVAAIAGAPEKADPEKLREVEARVFSGELSGKDAVREVRAAIDNSMAGMERKERDGKKALAKCAQKLRDLLARCDAVPEDLRDRAEADMREIEAALY